MDISLEQVATDALALSPAERVQLADRLWASIDGDGNEPLSQEWLSEIERRIREIDDGAETVPADEVFAKLRTELERRHPPA